MSEAPEDVVDRLQVIADLERGDMMPEWLLIDPHDRWNWAKGLTKLLNEAIAEIKQLRETLE